MFRVCQTSPASPLPGAKSRIVGRLAGFTGAPRPSDLPSFHHAEELRTHLPPWRGLLSRATSPRSSAFPPPGLTKPSASEQVKSHPHASLSNSSITSRALAETVWSIPQQVERRTAMYEMYPDWGPARNYPDSPMSQQAVQAALDLRDNGGQRPDDN